MHSSRLAFSSVHTQQGLTLAGAAVVVCFKSAPMLAAVGGAEEFN